MDVDIWASGTIPADVTAEYELDTSYPRLDSPFYRKLRKKYPRAFRRRTLNGSMSDTCSVYSDTLMSRMHAPSPRSKGQTKGQGHADEGRPPPHPNKAKADGLDDDMGIVGVPRPRQRCGGGLYRSTGSQYSSTTSLLSQIVDISRSMTYKSESMVSLRERLLRNQESWDRLLSDDPPKRLRQRGSQTDLSKVGLSAGTGTQRHLDDDDDGSGSGSGASQRKSDKVNGDDRVNRLQELGLALERMAAACENDVTGADDTRKLANGSGEVGGGRRLLPANRRFASPDSHDSAVEMDSASLRSNLSMDNNSHSAPAARRSDREHAARFNHAPDDVDKTMDRTGKNQSPSQASLPPPTPNMAERPSRARSRTPKLRSRGASPLLCSEPNSLNSSINGEFAPRSRLCSPDQRLMSPGSSVCSVQHRHGSDSSKYNKDSDADSGISQPAGKQPILIESQEPFYLTDDDTNSVIFIDSSMHEDFISRGHGHPRLGSQLYGSESNVASTSKSRSCERKREVKFEDEVRMANLAKYHRTLSQPAINDSTRNGLSYGDVVSGYGVPPGFDAECHSDVAADGRHSRSRCQGKGQWTASQNDGVLHPPPPPPYNGQSGSDGTERLASPLAPPPRSKHKQKKLLKAPGAVSCRTPVAKTERSLPNTTPIANPELNAEMIGLNTSLDDIDFDGSGQGKKKYKVPWRKNKGRFTPTKEMEKLNKIGEMSRTSSQISLASSVVSNANAGAPSFEGSAQQRDDSGSQKEASDFGQKRPTDKPPPVPKPKHLSSKPTESGGRRPSSGSPRDSGSLDNCAAASGSGAQLISAPGPSGNKPRPPPKPQISPEIFSASGSKKPEQQPGDYDVHEAVPFSPDYELAKATDSEYPEVEQTHESNSGGLANTDKEKLASSHKRKSRTSANRFSGYDDIDILEHIASENPYESVFIDDPSAPSGELSFPGQNPEEEEEVFHEAAVDVPPECDEYATVDLSRKTSRRKTSEPETQIINYDDLFKEDEEGPPLPERHYESELGKSKGLSGSQTSLSGGLNSLKHSARKKFSKLRKALSLEKLDKSSEDKSSVPASPEPMKQFTRSSSLKSLSDAFNFVKKIRDKKSAKHDNTDLAPEQRKPPKAPSGSKKTGSAPSPDTPQTPRNFRPIGNIKAIHEDGSRLIELIKPPHGPFGFYIARASAKYNNGIIISRLSDALPEHFFAGLLAVGDEILEINGQEVLDMKLEDIYDMIASEDRLMLRTLPYAAKTEI